MRFIKSKFFVVVVIVALSMIIVPVILASMGLSDVLRSGVTTVLKPGQKLFGFISDGIAGYTEYFTKYDALVEENAELIRMSKWLATIITDVPVNLDTDALSRKPADIDALREVFNELEFRTLTQRLIDDGEANAPLPVRRDSIAPPSSPSSPSSAAAPAAVQSIQSVQSRKSRWNYRSSTGPSNLS